MNARPPMVLLDDARSEGAADALLFERPERIFVARTPQEVVATLEQADSARVETGQSLAGYVAYEAGLALEPRDDHASYIASWIKVLQNDRRAILSAAAHAERAVRYLHSLQSAERREAA